MKFLIVGDWHSNLHEEAAADALEKLGHSVVRFAWHNYFAPPKWLFFSKIVGKIYRIQNKYLIGPIIKKINRDLLNRTIDENPHIVFIYRGTHILPKTIQKIKDVMPAVIIVGYNNDNPIASGHVAGLWRHFIASLPILDLVLAYRSANVAEFQKLGANRVEMLRSWYIPDRNFPTTLNSIERHKYECDVVFIGHYEDDMRIACLEEIVKQNWRLRLFGHNKGWVAALKKSSTLCELAPIHSIWGDDYNLALNGAKIALCFFSKLNKDTYTRRCFEIPASGTMMLSEYSDDLASMFTEGKEADYFRSPKELVEKLQLYLNDDERRASVAIAGRNKVIAGGHDVGSRMKQVVKWAKEAGLSDEQI